MSEILININIEKLDEGGYLATSDDLQGLIAQGRTVSEVMEIAQDVARKLIESFIEHGDPMPAFISAGLKNNRRKTTAKIPVGISTDTFAP